MAALFVFLKNNLAPAVSDSGQPLLAFKKCVSAEKVARAMTWATGLLYGHV